MKTLPEIFKACPDLLEDYIIHFRQLAVILVDAGGLICDCNPYFEELLASRSSPVGKPLQFFLSEQLSLADLSSARTWKVIRLPFQIEGSEHLFSGHILPVESFWLIIVHTFRVSHQQTVETLSRLTDELTDITRELNRKNRELEAANVRITHLMNTDPLTGLANRRCLRDLLEREVSSARRHHHPLSALMVDIDHFKSINDAFGHDVGDMVLVSVAQALKGAARKEDIVARFGGEEFVIVLSDSSLEDALQCAERMRKKVESLVFPSIDRPITASFGVTSFLYTEEDESMLKRADDALYEAKHSGRNCVIYK